MVKFGTKMGKYGQARQTRVFRVAPWNTLNSEMCFKKYFFLEHTDLKSFLRVCICTYLLHIWAKVYFTNYVKY